MCLHRATRKTSIAAVKEEHTTRRAPRARLARHQSTPTPVTVAVVSQLRALVADDPPLRVHLHAQAPGPRRHLPRGPARRDTGEAGQRGGGHARRLRMPACEAGAVPRGGVCLRYSAVPLLQRNRTETHRKKTHLAGPRLVRTFDLLTNHNVREEG